MDCTTINKEITETFNQVSTFSLNKKRGQEEVITNHFLDSILKLQSDINGDSIFLEELVLRFEKISWIENDTEESNKEEALNLINGIISITMDIHRLILNRYVFLNKNAKEFASKEIKRLKVNLDDIKEACNDLENICLILPSDKEFQFANERLQNL